MKNTADIELEINSLIEESEQLIFISDLKQRAKRKKVIVERVKFLNGIKLYLETLPRPEFIQKEIKRLEEKINIIEEVGAQKVVGRKNYIKYEKEQNLIQFKKQLETYKFIWNQ